MQKLIKPTLSGLLCCAIFLANITSSKAQQEALGYQKPPSDIADIINNAINRKVIISPDGSFLLVLEKQAYPTIAELAKPELKLAGLCINPQNNSLSNAPTYTSISLKPSDGKEAKTFIGLPPDAQIAEVTFSPDNTQFAFTNTTPAGVELWMASTLNYSCKKLSTFYLNTCYGTSYQWAADGQSILAKFVVDNKPAPPTPKNIPTGPIVAQNLGEIKPTKTYQNLLKNTYDEQLLDYYLQAQLKTVYLNGQVINYSTPAIYKQLELSPDGNYVLLSTLAKPYSYLVPIQYFANTIQLADKYGKIIRKLATIPLADNLPNGYDAVVTGQREFGWRADKPSTYYWVEAQDDGDPAKRTAIRDMIFTQDVNLALAKKLASCYYRFNKIDWGDDNIAIITERWFKTRGERRVFIKPSDPLYRVNLWDRYYENNYDNPGEFIKTNNNYHKPVLLTEYQNSSDKENLTIFSISEGCSAQGKRPYILKFNVKTKLTDTLLRSQATFYEKPIYFNNQDFAIITRESATQNPNYYKIELRKKKTEQLTYFIPPYPQLFGVQKQIVNYIRKDGLPLSATLYLPKTYIPKAKLPVLMWAYPREYKTANAAGQVTTSAYQFTEVPWSSPIFWVTQGYAVLDDVAMPIVGESNDQPNDTFIAQLIQNAEAAIDAIVKLGIADNKRIAIGGHSYGAFMAANLLAHTTLFTAGIARSGAYNRSLTPFGFQGEERTYWQVPEVYNALSPFAYADKIKSPLLLIHGQADENTGTFPMQSERFYNALKANGATTRLVMLPLETHSYKAKESILHTLWEMNNWLNFYVKGK